MAGEIDKKNLSLLDDEDTDGSEEIENDEDFDLDGDSDEELGAATDEESETDESEEIDDEVDLDEDDELDESENSDEQNGEKVGSNDSGEDNNSTAADSQEEKDAIIENLKKQNSKFRAQAKETLEKLGFKVDGDNVEEALEQAAAESDGVSLEEYRKTKDDAAEVEQARETLRRQKFETLAANDLAELKKSFPDLLGTRMNVPEMELLPVTASESFVMGEALVLSSGKLTKASGTTKPTHIAAKDYVAPASGAEKLPCYRIAKNMVFAVPVTYSSTAVAVVLGSKVTVDSDGLGVTDVTTSGVATVVDTLDAKTAAGDEIEVIFE